MTVYTSDPVQPQFAFPKLFAPAQRAKEHDPPHPCEQLAKHFESATGWVLGFQESTLSRSTRESQTHGNAEAIVRGKISITDMSADWPPRKPTASRRKCDELATTIDQLVDELNRTKLELQSAQVGQARFTTHNNVQKQSQALPQLTDHLLATAVNCANAGQSGCTGCRSVFYLLDDQDQNLVLQSSIGFTKEEANTLQRARPLVQAKADVEALAGAAIVMETCEQVEIWQTPFACQSAICIPVASSTTLLGTVWILSDSEQKYSDEQLNMIEIVAGRLAAEVQLAGAFADPAPSVAASKTEIVSPPFEGWSAELDQRAGSNVCWLVNADEQLVAISVRSNRRGSEIDPIVLDALVRAAETSHCDVQEVAEAIQSVLNFELDTDLNAIGVELAIAMIDPLSGELEVLRAGQPIDANHPIPVSLDTRLSASVEAGDATRVENVWSGYFGFLKRGQTLTLGGQTDSETLSRIVLSRN